MGAVNRMATWAAGLGALALVGWACASAPEVPERREIPALWRDAGRVLPAGEARNAYLEAADAAVAEAAQLRRDEAAAFAEATTVGERHDVSRDELYAPFGKLAGTRRERLMAYARHRMAMRRALSADEWTQVVKAVK